VTGSFPIHIFRSHSIMCVCAAKRWKSNIRITNHQYRSLTLESLESLEAHIEACCERTQLQYFSGSNNRETVILFCRKPRQIKGPLYCTTMIARDTGRPSYSYLCASRGLDGHWWARGGGEWGRPSTAWWVGNEKTAMARCRDRKTSPCVYIRTSVDDTITASCGVTTMTTTGTLRVAAAESTHCVNSEQTNERASEQRRAILRRRRSYRRHRAQLAAATSVYNGFGTSSVAWRMSYLSRPGKQRGLTN